MRSRSKQKRAPTTTRRATTGKRPRKRIIDERTSGSDDQRTPGWLIERIRKQGRDQRIGLDPAGSKLPAPASKCAVKRYALWKGQDGLVLAWRRHGFVFCNPPYGTAVRLWARKAVQEFGLNSDGKVSDELYMLVAARVDTRWFKLLWRHATAVLLFDRRLTFIGETDPAKFPSALIYFGERGERFVKAFRDLGLIVVNEQVWSKAHLEHRSAELYFPEARK